MKDVEKKIQRIEDAILTLTSWLVSVQVFGNQDVEGMMELLGRKPADTPKKGTE